MKKVLVAGTVVLIAGSIYAVFFYREKAVITNGISARGEEFVNKQKAANDQSWQVVNLRKDADPKNLGKNKRIDVDLCFSVTVPIIVTSVHRQSDCAYYIDTDEPVGKVYAYKREISVPNINELPDVIMRKQDKSYKESVIKNGERTFLAYKHSSEEGVERVAMYYTGSTLYAITFVTTSADDSMDQKFATLVSSFQLPGE